MDREGNFSIDECISECMQNRIEPSEAIERMKTMQQQMPGLNYSTSAVAGTEKGIRHAVSQPSYMQTGPPVFPEPIPSSAMRHPGPQYFEENRVMAHSQGASLGFGGFVQNRFPLVEGFPGNPFAQPSPLPLNQNQMGFGQMGFTRQMPGVFQKPETSAAGYQKPDSSNQFQSSETSITSENGPEKLTSSKKKDKTSAQKVIGPQKDSIPTSMDPSQSALNAPLHTQVSTTPDSQAGIMKNANPVIQTNKNMMIPFAKKGLIQQNLKDLVKNIETLRKSIRDLQKDKRNLEKDIHILEKDKKAIGKGKGKKKKGRSREKRKSDKTESELRKIETGEIDEKKNAGSGDGGEVKEKNKDTAFARQKKKRIRKKGPPRQCEVCKKWVASGSYLTKHMRIHTGERPYTCETCGKSFTDMSTYCVHKRIHTGYKPWTCDVCGKCFTSAGHAKGHMLVHTGEKPHGCDICGKRFGQKVNLIIHRRTHTGEKPYTCDVCGQAYNQKAGLTVHMYSHTGERPFECTICHKTYTKKFNLKEHMYVHTLDSQFTCDICQRNFSQAVELTKHKLRHFEAKPHACDICGKHFRRFKDLGQHKRIHTDVRPHKCMFCDKAFRAPKDLKRHIFVHTGESPHQCNLCGKRFHSAYPLKRHMIQHSDDDPLATLIEKHNVIVTNQKSTSGTVINQNSSAGHVNHNSTSAMPINQNSASVTNVKQNSTSENLSMNVGPSNSQTVVSNFELSNNMMDTSVTQQINAPSLQLDTPVVVNNSSSFQVNLASVINSSNNIPSTSVPNSSIGNVIFTYQ